MAWQAIVSSPEVAKDNKHQIAETEHLMKALLEQKNGLARRIFAKVGVDDTRLLEATEKFIQRQQKDQRFGKQLFKDFQISLKSLKSAIEARRGSQKVMDQGWSLLESRNTQKDMEIRLLTWSP
ncbi:hypothetical protein MKX01_007088 [Papaver californicum]|nr:hypothetical protein MKX01_007088 [Papaver californicum]